MVEKKCVLMDVDGVLLNLVPAVQDYVSMVFGKIVTPDMITAWDWDYCLGIPLMSEEFWDYVWNSELRMYPGAMDFISTLKQSFRVVAVSNRITPSARRNAWRQFSDFNFDEWILVEKPYDKLEHATRVNACCSLEDNPKTAASLGRLPGVYSCLMNRPWNMYASSITGDYHRVFSYDQFLKVCEEGECRYTPTDAPKIT